MSFLVVNDLSLALNQESIIDNINFSLENKQIVSILGPSGSGKSSILRLLAGLIKPDKGNITLMNKTISSKYTLVPTGQRDIGLMFQEDVLFPHLSVFDNEAFGVEKMSRSEKEKLVYDFLKKLGLLRKKSYYHSDLSGGEKQRVSLARILITNPKILLMDEPFSNLDSNLRKEICDYTITRLKKNKISVVFVTHDVEEALRISDKIIVLKKGKIAQIDTPENLYNSPNSKYVAKLLGSVNQFEIKANKEGEIITPFGKINCSLCSKAVTDCKKKKHFCIIRPEHLNISEKGIDAKIVNKFFLGSSWTYQVFISSKLPLLNIANCKNNFKKNDKVKINAASKNILIFQE